MQISFRCAILARDSDDRELALTSQSQHSDPGPFPFFLTTFMPLASLRNVTSATPGSDHAFCCSLAGVQPSGSAHSLRPLGRTGSPPINYPFGRPSSSRASAYSLASALPCLVSSSKDHLALRLLRRKFAPAATYLLASHNCTSWLTFHTYRLDLRVRRFRDSGEFILAASWRLQRGRYI